MSTRADRAEASVVALVFHAALVNLGLDTVVDSAGLWAQVQATPAKVATTGSAWLLDVLDLIGTRRKDARDLGTSFYRLFRALETGSTFPVEGEKAGGAVSLDDLRDDFYSTVQKVAPGTVDKDRELVDQNGEVQAKVPERADADVDLEELADDLEKLLDELDDYYADEAKYRLEIELGDLHDQILAIDHDRPAKEVDQLRDQLLDEAGAKSAAAIERLAENGGRDVVTTAGKIDKHVIGWVRVSRTGTPCGWCAMLISRGLWQAFTSKASANFATADAPKREEGEQYHENCQCYAEPIYSQEQYDEDPRFDLNRELSALWGASHMGGLSTKAALTKWRKIIRARNKRITRSGSSTTPQTAQEALNARA